jgi:hypothetical protein
VQITSINYQQTGFGFIVRLLRCAWPRVAFQVASPFHVQLAAFKALEAHQRGKLTCKTLHTELLYCLAGTKGVSAAVCLYVCRPAMLGRASS